MKPYKEIQDWVMQDGEKSYACTLPCSAYKVLLENGELEDPYYRENERVSTAVCDRDFTFTTEFTLDEAELREERIFLTFEGIDTLSDVYLNGRHLGRTDNMHRLYEFDITGSVGGENHLRVEIHSPNKYIAEHAAKRHLDGVEHCMDGYQYLRKAHCMFGWDWGPKLPDEGIWRRVYVQGYSGGRIRDVYYEQKHEAGRVLLKCKARVDTWGDWENFSPACTLTVTDPEGKKLSAELTPVKVRQKEQVKETFMRETAQSEECILEMEGEVEIPNPQLWWVRGLGEQPLYQCVVELRSGRNLQGDFGGEMSPSEESGNMPNDERHGKEAREGIGDNVSSGVRLDVKERRIGLRTLTISQEKDQWGEEFCFINNGVKVFAMGANYIPEDQIVSRRSKERTEKLLEDCKRANYNFIRVWGGGIYPDDYFFDLCDENGLIVWQDFMFACASYLLSPEFEATVRAEIRDNILRIRNHACLGLWCGNNEIESAWEGWGWGEDPDARADYLRLFEDIIPGILRELDPETFYWPSSPSSGGGFHNSSSNLAGDMHYWDIWHNFKPIEAFRQYYYRFCSEYGFESLPDMKTCLSFADPEKGDFDLCGVVMQAHQKCTQGNEKLMFYLAQMVNYPYDFERLIYCSQLVQADCIRSSVEHMRRARGRCMGSAYWQVNDSNPVISWSGIDWFGRWKALHYYAARFYAPILLSCDDSDPHMPKLFVTNDTPKGQRLLLKCNLRDNKARVLAQKELECEVPALSAKEVLAWEIGPYMETLEERRSRYLEYSLWTYEEMVSEGAHMSGEMVFEGADPGSKMISAGTTLFVRPKEFSFERVNVKAEVSVNAKAEGSAKAEANVKMGVNLKSDAAAAENSVHKGDFRITLTADGYCKSVCLSLQDYDGAFSDNWFDVHGEEPVTIWLRREGALEGLTPAEIEKQLTIRHY